MDLPEFAKYIESFIEKAELPTSEKIIEIADNYKDYRIKMNSLDLNARAHFLLGLTFATRAWHNSLENKSNYCTETKLECKHNCSGLCKERC